MNQLVQGDRLIFSVILHITKLKKKILHMFMMFTRLGLDKKASFKVRFKRVRKL